jgi:hypothetical protein
MQNSFYHCFLDENDQITLFIGGGGKSALITRLLYDCKSLAKTVVVSSLFPFRVPIEARTLINENVHIIIERLPDEIKQNKVVYLGKSIHKDVIEGFNNREIKKITDNLPTSHLFLEADITKGRSISGYNKVSKSFPYPVHRCINVIGADAFNQQKNTSWLSSIDSFWKSKKILSPVYISEWYKNHPALAKLAKKSSAFTYFINKVENIFVENLAIALAKSFKLAGVERVIIGSIFNSTFHVIK